MIQPESLGGTFAALADPTGRGILARLRQGDASIRELAEPFETSFAAVSKHVRVLEQAQLIRRQVRGREHRCSLTPGPLREAASWIDHYRAFWEQRLEAWDALLAAEEPAPPAPSRRGEDDNG